MEKKRLQILAICFYLLTTLSYFCQTTNVTIQDFYPYDQIEHQNIAQDPLAFKFVFDALDHDGPADAKRASGIFQ